MTDRPKSAPLRSTNGKSAAAAKRERLAAALRANLGRRKAQARLREESKEPQIVPPSPPRREG